MLYIHFQDEEEEFQPDDPEFIESLYNRNFERIQRIKSKVMEHLHDVEEARHYVEEASKKLDLTNTRVNLDAATEQENTECQEEGEELHPDYFHLATDNIDEIEENKEPIQNIYGTIELPDINTLNEKTRQFDPYQEM